MYVCGIHVVVVVVGSAMTTNGGQKITYIFAAHILYLYGKLLLYKINEMKML